MARKKSSQMVAQQERSRFVSVDLTKQQKADMKARMPDERSVFEWLAKFQDDGYKITVRHDEWNKCVACFCFPEDEESDNGGYILCGRGSDPFGAIRGALYRHYVLFEGVWGNRDHQSIDDD